MGPISFLCVLRVLRGHWCRLRSNRIRINVGQEVNHWKVQNGRHLDTPLSPAVTKSTKPPILVNPQSHPTTASISPPACVFAAINVLTPHTVPLGNELYWRRSPQRGWQERRSLRMLFLGRDPRDGRAFVLIASTSDGTPPLSVRSHSVLTLYFLLSKGSLTSKPSLGMSCERKFVFAYLLVWLYSCTLPETSIPPTQPCPTSSCCGESGIPHHPVSFKSGEERL